MVSGVLNMIQATLLLHYGNIAELMESLITRILKDSKEMEEKNEK